MTPRFYAPAASDVASEIELPEEEAQHLSRVLRLKPGDPLSVFNGSGDEFAGVVATVSKTAATVRLDTRVTTRAEPGVALSLAQAVLKGDKMDDVVRDAVMLGVSAVQPLVTARSETSLAALARGGRRERWQRIAVSSAKQCGRAVVPVIAPTVEFDGPASLAHLPAPHFALVEPGATPMPASLSDVPEMPAAATVIVGPEGGWTPAEVALGFGHAHPLRLGALTLRADAAAVVAIAALYTHWRIF